MTALIRNDKYDYFVDQAYSYYDVARSPQNYIKAVDYALKLSLLSSFNKLFSVIFYSPSDIVIFEDITLNTVQCCQHIINRITIDGGSNLDPYACYQKYAVNIQNMEYMLSNMRKQVYEQFILTGGSRKFRLSRRIDFKIDLNSV